VSRTLSGDSPEARLAQLTKRVEAIERRQPKTIAFGDGTRIRTRLGLHSDGKYGLRVWSAAGALVIDNTA
jgi:hypothetical protein